MLLGESRSGETQCAACLSLFRLCHKVLQPRLFKICGSGAPTALEVGSPGSGRQWIHCVIRILQRACRRRSPPLHPSRARSRSGRAPGASFTRAEPPPKGPASYSPCTGDCISPVHEWGGTRTFSPQGLLGKGAGFQPGALGGRGSPRRPQGLQGSDFSCAGKLWTIIALISKWLRIL